MSTLVRSRNATTWHKPLKFGLWAALGCLLAALLGEVWWAATTPPPPPPQPPAPPMPTPAQAVVLVLDTSYSMEGRPLEDMKQAAIAYVKRQDPKMTRIGVVNFDSQSYVDSGLSRDPAALEKAINGLQVAGATRMDLGLSAALSLLPAPEATGTALSQANTVPESGEVRSILLFTDGYPTGTGFFFADNGAQLTLNAAKGIHDSGVRMVAIGTDEADRDFLGQVTGDPLLVFHANDGQFGEAFKLAEKALNPNFGRSMLQSVQVKDFDPARELWRIAVWTALVGLGISVSLLLAQSRYSHQSITGLQAVGVAAGIVAGLLAGALGQGVFSHLGGGPMVIAAGRVFSWMLGGSLLAIGIAPFIPNLAPLRALLGGAAGGWLGAIGFVVAAKIGNDIAGRLLGAVAVGFAIGCMVLLAETAFRKAWLHVSYGPKDAFDISLGAQPVTVGSERGQSRIFVREAPSLAATYLMESGRPMLQIPGQGRQSLNPGDKRRFGNVEITLFTESQSAMPEPVPVPQPAVLPQPVPEVMRAPATLGAEPSWPSPPVTPSVTSGWRLEGTRIVALPESGRIELGRGAGNQIMMTEDDVSTRHAALTIGKKALTITDLNSTNGTYVNGRKLEPNSPMVVRGGDMVRFGKQEFRVVQG
jgi:Ca-activated chloride channel family protein